MLKFGLILSSNMMNDRSELIKKSRNLERVLNTIIDKSEDHIEEIFSTVIGEKCIVMIKMERSFWGDYHSYDYKKHDNFLSLERKWQSIKDKILNSAKMINLDLNLIKIFDE